MNLTSLHERTTDTTQTISRKQTTVLTDYSLQMLFANKNRLFTNELVIVNCLLDPRIGYN